jgi:uncharacterized protein
VVEQVDCSWVDGPVVGLDFEAGRTHGRTQDGGRFAVGAQEWVTFRIGDLDLGRAVAAYQLTSADLMAAGSGKGRWSARALNVARLLHSLAEDPYLTDGVVITDRHREVLSATAGHVDLDATPEEFDEQPSVVRLVESLGRPLVPLAMARNHLRRTLHGLKRLSDLRVPLPDGGYLLADAYVPLSREAAPAVMRLGPYGRAFIMGSVRTPTELVRSERREDRYFETEKAGRLKYGFSESLVSANAYDWVPRGYAVVRVDARGCGATPGQLSVFSSQEARDYYEAIEWCAAQSWCDGNVGLVGASYHATNQWAVAALRPPSLRAIIPWAGDVDAYRELAYPGGIFQQGYREWWWNTLVLSASGPTEVYDTLQALRDHPFDGEFYGPTTDGPVTPDIESVDIPAMIAVSQAATLHARGGFEAFARCRSKDRTLVVVDGHYYPFFYDECVDAQICFMDRWLRGEGANGPDPAVTYALRTGAGTYQWQTAPDWPPPEVTWQRLYFDAGHVLSHRATTRDQPTTYLLSATPPSDAARCEYAADPGPDWKSSGGCFVSDALLAPVDLVGPIACRVHLSATAADADVFVAVWVIDPNGRVIQYGIASTAASPMTRGCLKASHRFLDPLRATARRPFHLHTEAANAPLREAEIVPLDVELMQTASRLPAGSRIRVDVQPVEGAGGFADPTNSGAEQFARAYDDVYHAGHRNSIHTGPGALSFIELPALGQVRFVVGATSGQVPEDHESGSTADPTSRSRRGARRDP